jgi:Xaa-Pro aminopeptidase
MEKLTENTDAVLLTGASNLLYFTNCANDEAYALFCGDEKFYFTDSRYFEAAKTKLEGYEIKPIDEFFDFVKNLHISKLGVESSLTQIFGSELKERCGISAFLNVDPRIENIRALKSPSELENIIKAQAITDKTFHDVLSSIKEGITEIELAGTLESLLYINGADDLAFTSIVAFAENTSMPHAVRSDKPLKNGSLITMDFGAKYHGYCSDMTRTIAFGNVPDEQVKIYNCVLTAQQMALGIIFPGMTGKECDMIARRYFAENGYDKYFIHSLGHGVGLDIHEYPRLSKDSTAVMKENMVVTVEPGLYFENKFGVRIEDMIYFDKTNIINLTKSPKNMIIL